MKKLFWVIFTTTLGLYLVMVLWSLPYIAGQAGGLTPFDMRPSGYSTDEARQFLSALSDPGRAFYLETQHLLDAIYPGALGITMILAALLLYRALMRYLLICLSFVACSADYVENFAVADMLRAPLADVTAEMVSFAAGASVLKAGASTVVFVLLLVGLLLAGWRRWRG